METRYVPIENENENDESEIITEKIEKIEKIEKMSIKPIEPLLDPNNERFTIFPIKYPKIWEFYKTQQELYWKAEEIDFSKDYNDFQKLDKDEQYFIKMILAFFASSDGIVNFNLRERFLKEIKMTEAQVIYSWQMMMENIHGEVYSQMLENIVKDHDEKNRLFDSIRSVESIKMMADWSLKWIESKDPLPYRLIAMGAVEGIFFSGAFAAIFWLKKYRNNGQSIMNGLIKSNQFIARDEGMHVKTACMLYSLIIEKLDTKEVHKIIIEAVEISKIFNKDAIRCELIGMNLELMSEYIEYVADTMLVMFGYDKIYNTTNPFDFMESISLTNKTNFFESRPTEYHVAYTTKNVARDKINILDDF